MNCIPLIPTESNIFTDAEFKVIVYLYLLSISKVERGGLYAELSEEDIQDKFRYVDEDEVTEAIKNLALDELIIKSKSGKIQVGNIVDGVKKLFVGITSDISVYYDHVYKHADFFIESAKSSVRSNMARKVKSDLEYFEGITPTLLNNKDFVKLFVVAYTAVCQDSHREMMAKDYGQMANFSKLYDNTTVVQMILYYCAFYTKWSKIPTIASLVYNKDEIYMEAKGKEIKKSLKEGTDESGF